MSIHRHHENRNEPRASIRNDWGFRLQGTHMTLSDRSVLSLRTASWFAAIAGIALIAYAVTVAMTPRIVPEIPEDEMQQDIRRIAEMNSQGREWLGVVAPSRTELEHWRESANMLLSKAPRYVAQFQHLEELIKTAQADADARRRKSGAINSASAPPGSSYSNFIK
jgi:hypothetical protein